MQRLKTMVLMVVALLFSTQASAINVGDRVECNWKGGGKYYRGTVASAGGGRVFIHYDDGDKEDTSPNMCHRVAITNPYPVGTTVACNWKGRGTLYNGVVAEANGLDLYIHYNDGDKEYTTASSCHYQVGTRVSCYWKGGATLYRGRVAEIRGSQIYIHYDDGDREETTSEKCHPE